MYQSLPPQHNRYIKQTHPHPHQLSAPSLPPFHPNPQIPLQHFNPVPNQFFQAPQPLQAQKVPINAPVNAHTWQQIISQPVVNQPIVRAPEQTVTFRGNSTGKKPSNKELLAKADLILARSPTRQNAIPQASQTHSSANKEQPRTSHSSQQPAQTLQTLQTFSSPRPLHLETFTSPVRNAFEVPRSHPASIGRTHVEFPPHAFVSPPREQIIRSLPTEYLPTEHYHAPPQHLHQVPPQFIAPNIIRREAVPERFVHQIPHGVQHMPLPVVHDRPVPLLQPAPKPGQVHHMPLESAQFPSSEFSEIRRDFVQLRLDTQPQEMIELYTPTPFRIITEEPVNRALEFVPEITEDEDSNDYVPEMVPESDRGDYGRYNRRRNQVQRKLVAEPGYEKQPQQENQQNIGRRFLSGQQSGASSARRQPYRKDSTTSNGSNGQLARVNRDTQPASNVRDTMRSSKSEYIEPRQTLEQRPPRQGTPEKKGMMYGSKSENGFVKKEESLKDSKTWIYSANSETVNMRKDENSQDTKAYSANSEAVDGKRDENLKDTKTWIYSASTEKVNAKNEDSTKDAKTWIYSPNSERVRKEESPESKTREREAKYTNKVEVSLQTTGKKGNEKGRKMMKKVEQVLM